ncbi:MAG: DUF2499 domain-containing protein [Cyanobacteriota bacterium]|nr:DUF2499 domain-containing protein [Cyanobacteriota bacterium]
MNALSLPTWWIHLASVVEWIAAIFWVWQFSRPAEQREWRWLCWGMLPALVGAMCALTWHFFENDPSLAWIVTTQATATLIGNITLAIAAYRIWRSYRSGQGDPTLEGGEK